MKRGKYRKEDRVELLEGKSKYYYAIYYVDGIRYVESTRTTNVVKAVEKMKKIKAARMGGLLDFHQKEAFRLPDLFDEFLEWYGERRSPLSLKRHETSRKPLEKFFKKIRVRRITTALVEEYVKKRDASANTIRNELHLLSGAFRYAIKKGYVETNPVSFADKPSARTAPAVIMTDDDIKLVLSLLDKDHHKLLFKILLFTGMRISEAINLEWSDIDFDAGGGVGEIIVRKAKRHKWRRVPMFSELREILLEVNPKIGHVIKHNRKKGYERGIYNVFYRLFENNPDLPKFSHHTLRHTFVSRCYKAGIPDLVIATWTGHSVQVLRDIYLHLHGSDFEEIQKLQQFSLGGKNGNIS